MIEKNALILIVDDVTRNLQVLGSFLREAHYDVSAAVSGKQAIEIAADVNPDLILLDIMMPEMDGFETCRRLKSDERTRDIPVVFLTAKTAEEDIVHGFELGAVDYITKPFQRQELLERVRVHVDLRRSRLELARTVRDKDKLFSIIAHDLRGPLGSFMSISDYLTENLDELDLKEIKPLFREMRQTSKSVYALLENLLEWSRIQLGTVAFHPSEFKLASVAINVEAIVRAQVIHKELTLENLIQDDILVMADPQMISTVLRNLVSNAIKYTPRGGRIYLEAQREERSSLVTVYVRDTGVGMSEQMQSALSEGAQVNSMPGTEKEKGTGLGMMLCREMIARHGQQLKVESAIGEGSTFSFTLELAGP
ncbi:MAG: hybrid sensor histidine kinase/response regulator [Bacteroidetes bacterium]|nr:hybrid sensor histidine kinase/response regulator [Bacteroidota bacterium]